MAAFRFAGSGQAEAGRITRLKQDRQVRHALSVDNREKMSRAAATDIDTIHNRLRSDADDSASQR
jgi:hypothetical protein